MDSQTLTPPAPPAAGQTPGTSQQPQQQIDPTALTLSRAIRQVENTGYNQTVAEPNGSSSFGAYGWNGNNFQEWAQQYGLNPEDTSQTNQDHLAYLRIKSLLDKGIPQSQVAAIWNGAKLVNGQYVPNNPDYVKQVQSAYEKLIGGGGSQSSRGNMLAPGVPALNISNPTNADNTNQPASLSGFGNNVLKSGKNVLGGIGNAIMHPLQTLGNLWSVGAGGVKSLFGVNDQDTQNFGKVADFYNQRYGVTDLLTGNFQSALNKIGNTLYTDPVGSALDASMLFSAGGGAVSKIGELGDLENVTRAGGLISKIGETVDPLSQAAKAVGGLAKLGGRAVAEALGVSTGAGSAAIREAFTNPTSEGLLKGLRGGVSPESIVAPAQEGLNILKGQRSADYQAALENIKQANPGSVDISTLSSQMDKQLAAFGVSKLPDGTLDFSRSRLATAGQRSVQEAYNMVNGWGLRPGDRTPAGLNTLQMKLGDIMPETNNAKSFIYPLQKEVKNILTQVPGYAKMQSDYAKMSDMIDDVNRSFLSGSTETAIRKLTQLTRSSNPFRLQLARQLQDITGIDLVGQAAGSQLSSFAPTGITGRMGDLLAGGLGTIHPSLLAAIPFTSPRLVATLAQGLGIGNRAMMAILGKLHNLGVGSAIRLGQRIQSSGVSPNASGQTTLAQFQPTQTPLSPQQFQGIGASGQSIGQ